MKNKKSVKSTSIKIGLSEHPKIDRPGGRKRKTDNFNPDGRNIEKPKDNQNKPKNK